MQLIDILTPDRIAADLSVSSKSRLLEHLAGLLADGRGERIERAVLDALVAREHLGSTGLGQGVAIPHGRVAADIAPTAAFVRLQRPIDFGAPGGEPVDLVLALVVPVHFTELHLGLLAQVAEVFSDKAVCARLRDAANAPQLLQCLGTASLQFSEV